jgi:two-component system sensor histidine kinase HydH
MSTRMAWQILLSGVACAGHLAFALMLWLRRGQGSIAFTLSLLFLDTFVWTFAALVYTLTRVPAWHWLDHAFASFLPVLTVQVVAGFVGRRRALVGTLRVLFGLALAIALLSAHGAWWWRLLLGYAIGCTLLCSALLLRHLRATRDATERRRSVALLVAVLFGTLLASTDLWVEHVPGVPRLTDIGMLLTLMLVAACVLRLELLGQALPPPESAADRLGKLVSLGRFSEQLAHDLKNPLAALKGSVQFLLVEHEQGRSLDAQAPFLRLMLEQVERTSRVVDAYQRLASVQPIKEATSLNELVADVLGMQRFASTPDIAVRSRLEASLPPCQLDAELMQTTLENLLRNAFDAMPQGGAITVETRAATGAGGTPGISLEVRDEGVGMDARVLERATDQFFTTKATGTGLGLNFAERVARAHQGNLELSSEVGRGTTVRLWLPLPAA